MHGYVALRICRSPPRALLAFHLQNIRERHSHTHWARLNFRGIAIASAKYNRLLHAAYTNAHAFRKLLRLDRLGNLSQGTEVDLRCRERVEHRGIRFAPIFEMNFCHAARTDFFSLCA